VCPTTSRTQPSVVSRSRVVLARRLRALRLETWPGVKVTQPVLAGAIGVAVPSISSWESVRAPVAPPAFRLSAYATFFATPRSMTNGQPRLLGEDELTEAERDRRDELDRELRELRSAALAKTGLESGFWSFPDRAPVRIVCGEIPHADQPRYADSSNPNYLDLLRYADIDAMVELFGHLRAVNPTSDVRFTLASDADAEDFNGHVVLIGGIGLNEATQWFTSRVRLPIEQRPDADYPDGEVFILPDGRKVLPMFGPAPVGLALTEDVGLLVRLANPMNAACTLTICSGTYTRGVLGAVRCLTEAGLRNQNAKYLQSRFPDQLRFAILMRVPVYQGVAVTPDLSTARNRHYEWPEAL